MNTDTYPWLVRGGSYYYTVNAGIFYYYFFTATNTGDYSFRLVLTSNS